MKMGNVSMRQQPDQRAVYSWRSLCCFVGCSDLCLIYLKCLNWLTDCNYSKHVDAKE